MKNLKYWIATKIGKFLIWLLAPEYFVNISFLDVDSMWKDLEGGRLEIKKKIEEQERPMA